MARYVSVPTEVEAEQWFPGKQVEGVHGATEGARRERACYPEGAYDIDGPSVVTIHKKVTPIEPGDWIVTEPDGVHRYPIKPDVFARRYRPVADELAEQGETPCG